MKALIKWPGGKTRLLREILPLVPPHDEYCEPFVGGGALFFAVEPAASSLNDISSELVSFYRMVQSQDAAFLSFLDTAARLFERLGLPSAGGNSGPMDAIGAFEAASYEHRCPVFDHGNFLRYLEPNMKRSKRLSTAMKSSFYYMVRDEYNTARKHKAEGSYESALFFLVRELCFGSMFRYNSKDDFNIPYGGFSYDGKDLAAKVKRIRKAGSSCFFRNCSITSHDFRDLLPSVRRSKGTFVFLDPPYDSRFTGYSGNDFGPEDHVALRDMLAKAEYSFLLAIAKTEFIERLYEPLGLNAKVVPSKYSYSVRGRNDRSVDYMLIRNY
ncbi:MAG TPA: DNA adenine methylase [Bacillota bacterium]|nr:DNA adenine methylase [Bacillota bacterium]